MAYLRTGIGLFQQVKNSGLRLQIGAIDKVLEFEKNSKHRYPKDFTTFMRENFRNDITKDSSMDPWGKSFHFESRHSGYQLSSAGPDGVFGNGDDVIWLREGSSAKFIENAPSHLTPVVTVATIESKKEEDPLFEQIESWMLTLQSQQPKEDELNEFIAKFLKNHWVE